MKRWITEHFFGLMVGLTSLVVVLVGVVLWLVIVEADDRDKLQGVKVVGPCRAAYVGATAHGATNREGVAAATRDKECQLQSKLLFAACIHKDLHPACTLAKIALRGEDEGTSKANSQDNAPSGGDASSAPPGSSPPSPSPDGGGPTPQPNPPNNPNPPSDPPSNPPDDGGVIGDVLDDLCTVTTPLGVCLN